MKRSRVSKPKRIVPMCSTHPLWSVSRYQSFVRSAMRRAWLKWPPRFEALKLARRTYNGPNKKQKWEFQCAHCKCWYIGNSVSVDHIVPWGSIWELSLSEAWGRLLVGVKQLQILCKGCHTRKTNSE